MPGIVYCDLSVLDVLDGKKVKEIVFSGSASGRFPGFENVSRVSAGLERAKRYISSEAFDAVLFTGFSDVSAEAKPSAAAWLRDHAEEPGSPAVVITGSAAPQPEIGAVRIESGDELLKYLPKVK